MARLDVGGGHRVYWEIHGNPDGKAAVVLHGGPGSGCGTGWLDYFDLSAYKVVLFDQRGCGRSTPSAADDLTNNTTQHLIADIELLRLHLGIDRWLVFGGSWGATLGLAYAERHAEAVSEMVLFSITNTTRREVDWVTEDMGRVFPEEWERFKAGAAAATSIRLVDAYAELLADPDPATREEAARDWCAWEDTHVGTMRNHRPDPRYEDPEFRMVFARLVTHYWRHAAWLEDGILIREAGKLAGIPGVLVHGRLDISSPPDVAWNLAKAWPDAELILVDEAGHGSRDMSGHLRSAISRFAIT